MDDPKKPTNWDEYTLPSKATIARRPRAEQTESSAGGDSGSPAPPAGAPLILQHFFDGAMDLDKELTARFANMPLLSVIRVRQFGGRVRSGAALMTAQDGSAAVIVEVDAASKDVQFTYTLGGMLALSFELRSLSDMDRAHWIEPMRRENSEVAFLWNQARWENDYLICAAHKHHTNLFAFSSHHTQAAARLTTDVSRKLLNWIAGYWSA